MAGDLDDERAVLGDELQQRGDPQGELIGLQLALEALPASAPPARRNVIAAKVAALLDHHHDAFYGALAPHVSRLSRPDVREPVLRVKQWRGGFADAIWIQRTKTTHELADVIRVLRTLPIARFVRHVELGGGDHHDAVAALADMQSLRALVLPFPPPTLPKRLLGDISVLEPLLPQLEELKLEYGAELSRRIVAPMLRKLDIYLRDMGTRGFDDELPRIEDLTLFGFALDRDFFTRYPLLRRLGVIGQQPAGWFEHVLRTGALARLDTLKISTIGDTELRLIAEHADQFAAMKRLDLSGNYFSPEARAAVADRLPACVRYR